MSNNSVPENNSGRGGFPVRFTKIQLDGFQRLAKEMENREQEKALTERVLIGTMLARAGLPYNDLLTETPEEDCDE